MRYVLRVEPDDIQALLQASREGSREALDRLLPYVYEDLRRLAHACLRSERGGHTLQPTALVHEAYLRLMEQHSVDWSNRAQFLAIAARMMRRVLVNYAEARAAEKRKQPEMFVVENHFHLSDQEMVEAVTLDRALAELRDVDERHVRIVELRYYAGFTLEETAEAMGISLATLKREWAVARVWIRRALERAAEKG